MFNALRLKLTLQFMALASVVYLCLSGLGIYLLNRELTGALDDELMEVIAVSRRIVKFDGKCPYFITYPTEFHKIHLKLVVQLWDKDKHLCGNYGVIGVETLFFPSVKEVCCRNKNLRCMARSIERDGRLIGYLQIQAPTAGRELVLAKSFQIFLLTMPLLLFGLAMCGYWFAGLAIRPVQHTYDLQKKFLADAGHELKTPITIMQLTLENLADDMQADSAHLPDLNKVLKSAKRLGKLVQDLIFLTMTEQYSEPPSSSRIQLAVLLEEVMDEQKDIFCQKEVELIDELEPVETKGNRDSLYAIFSNLVKNAMIYTDAGGKVSVSLTRQGNQAVVKVADTGIGIAPEHLEKLFDRFYRIEGSRSRFEGGSGLGLAIVKAMIAQQNGSIHVESKIGEGSTFTVALPGA